MALRRDMKAAKCCCVLVLPSLIVLVYVCALKHWASQVQFPFSGIYAHICMMWGLVFFSGLLERFIFPSPLPFPFCRVNLWWFVMLLKTWWRSWENSGFAKKPTMLPLLVSWKCLTGIAKSCRKSFLLFPFPHNVAAVTGKCEPRGFFLYEPQ